MMTESISAEGYIKYRLGHMYGDRYCATIVLKCETPMAAYEALYSLGGGWKAGSKHANCLAWYGVGSQLQACKKILAGYAVDETRLENDGIFYIFIPVFLKSWSSILIIE